MAATASSPSAAEAMPKPEKTAPSSSTRSSAGCSSSGMAVRVPSGAVLEGWWGDGRSHSLRHRPELRRLSDARPQDDLFGHVNGRWLAEYEIPADRATDGAFRSLYDRAEEQIRDLITGAAAAAAPTKGTDEQRIGDLYASFMDEPTVERRGVQPLLDELATIDAAADPGALAAVLGALQRTGVGGGDRRLHRHRLQGLHPLPAAPEPVRARPARRVLLPRRAARRDPGRLSAPHRRDVRAGVRRGAATTR